MENVLALAASGRGDFLEEKLREAACIGDVEAVSALLRQKIDVNSKNSINGWTPLHWACRRGNEEVARMLINQGADKTARSNQGETPVDVCISPQILNYLGESSKQISKDADSDLFVPNYLKNPPLNGEVTVGELRQRPSTLTPAPTPTHRRNSTTSIDGNEDLVLLVRIANLNDRDFIEIELPPKKLTYRDLLKICCDELEVSCEQVERVRKLPNTRLRKDSDVRRLTSFQALEIVLKPSNPDKNCYQSISTCKDQTILY